MTASRASSPWWKNAFGAHYPSLYAHRDEASASDDVAFAAAACGMRRGDRVLDVGCGNGRHARALADAGMRVVATDRSPELLADAASRVRPAGLALTYLRSDFRALPFRPVFDHAMSFFTSFGYFDDEGNAAQLRSVRRSLRADGCFFIDFLNARQVAATLVPRSERRLGELHALEERAIRAGRVEKDVTLTDGIREVGRWRESVRLYESSELEAMLVAAEFAVTARFGDLRGGPWAESSARFVLVAVAR